MAARRRTGRLYWKAVKGRGRLVQTRELSLLLNQTIWYKLSYIREELDDMYPGEYSIKNVADSAGISLQGLRDAEGYPRGQEGNVITPRESTLDKLAEAYVIPRRILDDDCTPEEVGGFFLGKIEDKDAFFDGFYFTYRQQHKYDTRDWLITQLSQLRIGR